VYLLRSFEFVCVLHTSNVHILTAPALLSLTLSSIFCAYVYICVCTFRHRTSFVGVCCQVRSREEKLRKTDFRSLRDSVQGKVRLGLGGVG